MNELDLYKFLEEKAAQLEWWGKDGKNEELIVWIPLFHIEEFIKLLGNQYLNLESGMEARLQNDYIVFDLVPICEYFDIELERILKRG